MRVPKIDLYEGNVRTLSFRLRREGLPGFWDVSAASAINLETEDEEGESFDHIPCLPDAEGADWANGLVVVDVSAVCAHAYGTYKWSLTLQIGSETITANDGVFELLPRPGFPAPV